MLKQLTALVVTALVALVLVPLALAAPGLSLDSLTWQQGDGSRQEQAFSISWSLGAGETACALIVESPNQRLFMGVGGSGASGAVVAEPGASLTFTLQWADTEYPCSVNPRRTVSIGATAVGGAPAEPISAPGTTEEGSESESISNDPIASTIASVSSALAPWAIYVVDTRTGKLVAKNSQWIVTSAAAIN